MYEKHVVHAIQNASVKDLQTRYRIYPSREKRDETLTTLLSENGNERIFTAVTLTITAETVSEQMSLDI